MLRLVFAFSLIFSSWSLPDDGLQPAKEPKSLRRSISIVGIIGENEIDIREAPYQVSVQTNGYHGCGGSLISADWVITAATCFNGDRRHIYVRAGSTFPNEGGQLIEVERLFEHDSNLALLKLSKNFTLSESLKTISLATTEPASRTKANITGWGQPRDGSSTPPVNLRRARVNVISLRKCRKHYEDKEVFDYNLCAFSRSKDTCRSDTGGPLVVNDELVGVVSWGDGCAKRSYPGVHISISKFTEWIEETMKKP